MVGMVMVVFGTVYRFIRWYSTGWWSKKRTVCSKNDEIIALFTDWTPFQSGDGTITYEPSMRVEQIKMTKKLKHSSKNLMKNDI